MHPKSRTELAHLYAYSSTRTFTRHLKAKGIALTKHRAIYWQDQLKIYAEMGVPPMMEEEEKEIIRPRLLKYCKNNHLPPPPDL